MEETMPARSYKETRGGARKCRTFVPSAPDYNPKILPVTAFSIRPWSAPKTSARPSRKPCPSTPRPWWTSLSRAACGDVLAAISHQP